MRVYVGILARGARPDAYTFLPLLNAAGRRAVEQAVGDAVHAHVVAKSGLELNAHFPKLTAPHGEEAVHMCCRMLRVEAQSSVHSETRSVLFPPACSFPLA